MVENRKESRSNGRRWHLKVHRHEGEEGAESPEEEEVENFGHMHLVLDDLDGAPEAGGLEGLLPRVNPVVIVEAGLLPLWQPCRSHVLVPNRLQAGVSNLSLRLQIGSG